MSYLIQNLQKENLVKKMKIHLHLSLQNKKALSNQKKITHLFSIILINNKKNLKNLSILSLKKKRASKLLQVLIRI